jgi:phosphoribosylformimino-5-aminoimidazole carboxamide ribotide isomerase
MKVIPAIDIFENKIVRLSKGDFAQMTFYENTPLEQALLYRNHKFNWLHLVDLAGSLTGSITAYDAVSTIKRETGLNIEFGGGIRDWKTCSQLLDAGVDKLIIGSVSIKDKNMFEEIISKAGAGKIVAAVDVLDNIVYVKGWTENSGTDLYGHIRYCQELGVSEFLCTDISRDGMLQGPNTLMYKNIIEKFPSALLIASGGVKSADDLEILAGAKLTSAVVGKAIYENKISLEELEKFA